MRILMTAAALALAGCAAITDPLGMEDPFAVPQPFQGVERNDAMLDQAIMVPALVVETPQGLGEEAAAALRGEVVEAARRHDVPAFAELTAMAWVLRGQAATIAAADKPGKEQRVISWQLLDPQGTQRTQFPVSFSGTDEVLVQGAARLVAEQTATALDAALARPRTQVAQSEADRPVAYVGTVKGAPGDGNAALARALGGVLPFKGVRVEAVKAKAQWRIEAKVTVVRGSADADVVTIVWRVLDAKGKEAGTIAQENAVPRGRLNKPWAEIAGYAAEAAAEGIAQLLQQVAKAKPA
jgi:hypothetical protein